MVRDKFIVWGAKDLGKYAIKELRNEGYDVAAVIDNCIEMRGKKIEGISVVSPQDIRDGLENKSVALILTVMNSKSVFEVLEQAEDCGFKNIGILKPRAGKYGLRILPDSDEIEGEIIWYAKEGRRTQVIPRMEINLIDNCNLNCVGCTHFSSIYKPESVLPYTQFVEELKQIRKIGRFVRLRFLGGEPFMVLGLERYIRMARETFPEADIEIVTNGLLIGQLSSKLFRTIRECKIGIVITPYKPTMDLKEKITKILDFYEVWWNFDGKLIAEFSRQLTLEDNHNGHEASQKCISSGCLFLRNGKIYKCPIAGLINDFAQYYNLGSFPETGINIYDDSSKVYKNVRQCATAPTVICNYCSEKIEMVPWTVKRTAHLNDWLYDSSGIQDKENVE